jgi:hypothetical protein
MVRETRPAQRIQRGGPEFRNPQRGNNSSHLSSTRPRRIILSAGAWNRRNDRRERSSWHETGSGRLDAPQCGVVFGCSELDELLERRSLRRSILGFARVPGIRGARSSRERRLCPSCHPHQGNAPSPRRSPGFKRHRNPIPSPLRLLPLRPQCTAGDCPIGSVNVLAANPPASSVPGCGNPALLSPGRNRLPIRRCIRLRELLEIVVDHPSIATHGRQVILRIADSEPRPQEAISPTLAPKRVARASASSAGFSWRVRFTSPRS